MIEIPQNVKLLLEKKFNIVDHLVFNQIDTDFDGLANYLNSKRKNKFEPNDRIIVEHMDTDFYFDQCSVGVNLLNFFNTIKDLHYPYFVFIFYTNHYGLAKEIELLCKNHPEQDRPMVIESLIGNQMYNTDHYHDHELNAEKIQHHALCMMNMIRAHRHAVYHSLKSLSPDKIALQVTVPA